MPHRRLSHDAQPPHPQSPNPDEIRSQGQRLHHVSCPAHAALVDDVRLVSDGTDDVFQRIQASDSAVDLASRVVGHDDAVAADVDGLLRVSDGLDVLETDWPAAADPLPRLDEPRDLVPAPRSAVPDAVDLQRARLVELCDGIDSRFLETFLEDWIAEAEVRADAVIEAVVGCGDIIVSPA